MTLLIFVTLAYTLILIRCLWIIERRILKRLDKIEKKCGVTFKGDLTCESVEAHTVTVHGDMEIAPGASQGSPT